MPAPRGLPTWQLFAIAVAIWSTTWHAILYQLEHTAPEAGVAPAPQTQPGRRSGNGMNSFSPGT